MLNLNRCYNLKELRLRLNHQPLKNLVLVQSIRFKTDLLPVLTKRSRDDPTAVGH